MVIDVIKNKWDLVIGLEVHAQLNTYSKLFSHSSTNCGQENNTQVSFIDSAMPGMLPVTNQKCIEFAVKAGLALNATVNNISAFDRKNYFYPDLPQGYQISQFFRPIISDGNISITTQSGQQKKIVINRIHIEQDAGKSIHDQSVTDTFIDLNRAGVPLIEIVTNPDFTCSTEVEQFIKKLRDILKYIDVCDGDLDKGSIRCDANVSVRKQKDHQLGTRVEIKNLNSFKYISKAISYEFNRQIKLLQYGKEIIQETRLFDVCSGQTKSMRIKEAANDYRYFPDPDLLPLKISPEFINKIKRTLPELPEAKKIRYIKDFGLTEYDAAVLTAEKNVAQFFETVASTINPKLCSNWICVELFGKLKKRKITFSKLVISTKNFSKLLQLIICKTISGKIAKKVLDYMLNNNDDPEYIIAKYNFVQISDISEIKKYIDQVVSCYPDKVKEFSKGKNKLFSFFVGQVMKISKGKADPTMVNEILMDRLHSNSLN